MFPLRTEQPHVIQYLAITRYHVSETVHEKNLGRKQPIRLGVHILESWNMQDTVADLGGKGVANAPPFEAYFVPIFMYMNIADWACT